MTVAEFAQNLMNDADERFQVDGDMSLFVHKYRNMVRQFADEIDYLQGEVKRMTGLVEYLTEFSTKLTNELEEVQKTKW